MPSTAMTSTTILLRSSFMRSDSPSSPSSPSKSRKSLDVDSASKPLSITHAENPQKRKSSINHLKEKPTGNLVDSYGNAFEIPDFSINDIRNAIPKKCLQRSGLRGLSYVARDIASLALTFWLWNAFVTPEFVPSKTARGLLWTLYTVIQGLFATGLWVLAHECGHHSFSNSRMLNITTGWLCHSALLVPFFSWQISHRKHHQANGHLERDTVFVPKTREFFATKMGRLAHEVHELIEETPIATLLELVGQQLIGWPGYLLTGWTSHVFNRRQEDILADGRRGVDRGQKRFLGVNHFKPSNPIFDATDKRLIFLSDLGVCIAISILTVLCQKYSFANMLIWYFIPYLWVNHWLVAITFLQHTDPALPHYSSAGWTYVRGAAATIDRDFGFIGREIFHGIIETHVLHHFVSTIPFYHAEEATKAIKPIMGSHYKSNTQGGPLGFLKCLWTSLRWCQWIEPVDGTVGQEREVFFYRNHNGLGVPPAKL